MKPLYVSFFTPAYAAEAEGLRTSLDAFGLEHDLRAMDSVGSWVRNCAMKPAFLRRMRQEHPGVPLVWLDADARVRKYPELLDRLDDCDVACCHRDGTELLSGTLYFAPTPVARELLEAWELECQRQPEEWDQRCLQHVLRLGRWRATELPPSYVAIFDSGMCPPDQWVISHHQASRRLKRMA